MAGCDPRAIKEALAAQLRANVARDFTVYAYEESSPDGRSLMVYEDPAGAPVIDYFGAISAEGLRVVNLVVEAVVAGADAESRSIVLDELASAGAGMQSSIPDAVNGDRSLGLVGVDAVCLELRSKTTTDESGSGSAVWPVQVSFTEED